MALAEVLPGQVPQGGLSIQSLLPERGTTQENTDVAVWGVRDVEYQQKDEIQSKEDMG